MSRFPLIAASMGCLPAFFAGCTTTPNDRSPCELRRQPAGEAVSAIKCDSPMVPSSSPVYPAAYPNTYR
jgi:hypothetical protein